jgi:hypothetical protein
MTTSSPSFVPTRSRLFRGLSILCLLVVATGVAFGQADQQRRRGTPNGQGGNGGDNGGRGNFDPQQMQQQMMERLREQFGITDDAEWKIIGDRVTAVTEARRAIGGGGPGGFAGFGGTRGRGGDTNGGGGGGDRGPGGGRRGGGSPESDALRQAIQDNLPEAELKSRMTRLRETRKANEEKLTRAQEELRAVLSVRQEAVAVMFGLLP